MNNRFYDRRQSSRTTNRMKDLGAMSSLAAYIGGSFGLRTSDIEALSYESLKQLQAEEGMWLR